MSASPLDERIVTASLDIAALMGRSFGTTPDGNIMVLGLGEAAGDEEARITAAIERTRAFFESLGVPTRLSAYGLGAEAVDAVVANLEAHGMTALGEHRDLDAAAARRILTAAL